MSRSNVYLKEGVRARTISPSPLSHSPFTGPKRANPAIRFRTPGPSDRPGPVKKMTFMLNNLFYYTPYEVKVVRCGIGGLLIHFNYLPFPLSLLFLKKKCCNIMMKNTFCK